MDIASIRLTNVDTIIKAKFDGKKARFAEAIDKFPNYISTWWAKNPDRKRNIGSNIARDIEVKLGLDEGWLDIIHTDNSDLEQDHLKKQQLKLASGNTYEIPLTWSALLEQQQLKLTLLQPLKGKIMLLSTDQDAWSIQLVGTHPNFILNQGWGIVIEPNSPITVNEYALITRKNGELLLRVIAYKDEDKLIITNPITSEQTTLPWADVEKAEYCYVAIPPSKIMHEANA